MEVNKQILVISFLITLTLFISVLFVGSVMNNRRYAYINSQFNELYSKFNEMQTFFLMANSYGDKMACLAFEKKLQEMDKFLWNLGRKIDTYRAASEQFQKDLYYLQQKKIFNQQELSYLMMIRTLKERCDLKQTIILFFYKNADECKKCDDQSFVLTDINKKLDPELAIFSFDMDLNLTSLKVLADYYGIDKYPCTIIEDHKFCGMQDKTFILKKLCEYSPWISIC